MLQIFRPFSRSLLRTFLSTFPYSISFSHLFNKNIHFSLVDLFLLLILVLLPFAKKIGVKSFFLKGSRKYLTLMILSGVISLFFSLFTSYYQQYFSLLNLALMLLLFHVALTLCENRKELIEQVIWCFLFVSFLECIVACYQFFSQQSLGWTIIGETILNPLDLSLASYHLNGEEKRLILRPYGTFYHPNILGGFLAMCILLSYYCYLSADRLWQKVFLIPLIPLQILTLFLTTSRGGMLCFAVGTLMWLSLILSRKAREEKKKRKSLSPLAWMVTLSILLTTFFLHKQLESRGGFINYNSVVQGSDAERFQDQSRALEMIKAYPLTGVGYNCYTLFPDEILSLPRSPRLPHNIYLLIGSELGLLGLGCFLCFFLSLFRPYIKGKMTLLSATLLSILVG
ncbi:MAG: O-antigen ligase family protein, partial [Simkania negevensis]|nr:O-antigen ligase family protein [Simkania negevensis]